MAASHEGKVFEDIGLMVPRLVLPPAGTDMSKWSVIACDQYTSEPAYWKRIAEFVGEAPSMLHLIFPEVYLPENRNDEIISKILAKMKEYCSEGVLSSLDPGFVLVDRKTPTVPSRLGLVVALDLELYSFEKGSQSLIRPTEKTIESRLPPRVAIRKDAKYESPHILVLLDDPDCTVIEPLAKRRKTMKTLYDFDLMESSGHLTGHHVTEEADIETVADALKKLASQERFRESYQGTEEKKPILFAVGDGNHSLATAKRCWEAVKASGGDTTNHPARHALVELMNVHDPGLMFHPIHRLVEHVNCDNMVSSLTEFFEAESSQVSFIEGQKLDQSKPSGPEGEHSFEFVSRSKNGVFVVSKPTRTLAAGTLDGWLNGYLEKNSKAELDYVHEEYTIQDKCKAADSVVGFLLPAIDKNSLIKTVVKEGTLPRKTFSMGHAPEKRFYTECRAIL